MISGLIDIKDLLVIREKLKQKGKKVVFTNGCFDILHAGHVDYLKKAKELGDVLIVGLNSDPSVKKIKGNKRPIVNQNERAFILSNLNPVDYVVLFEEETPYKIIKKIIPDILVKGSDWIINDIVGKDIVESNGGAVKTVDFVTFQSTTDIIKKVLAVYNE